VWDLTLRSEIWDLRSEIRPCSLRPERFEILNWALISVIPEMTLKCKIGSGVTLRSEILDLSVRFEIWSSDRRREIWKLILRVDLRFQMCALDICYEIWELDININICSIELKWDGKITKIRYDNEIRWIRITVWNGRDLGLYCRKSWTF